MAAGRIFSYHAVCNSSLPAAEFKRHLKGLQRYFSIVSLNTFVEAYLCGDKRFSRMVALTFDDGLRNHARIVYPLLKEAGIPATFFICPSLVDEGGGAWLWNQELRQRLLRLDASQRCKIAREAGLSENKDSIDTIVKHLKQISIPERAHIASVIRKLTLEFIPTDEEKIRFELMGWEDIRSLDSALVTIGSHTLTHPSLPTLDEKQIQSEVADSRQAIEKALGRPVDFFCYPNGANDALVLNCVKKCYQAAVTTVPKVIVSGEVRHLCPRLGGDGSWPLLAWRLHRPAA